MCCNAQQSEVPFDLQACCSTSAPSWVQQCTRGFAAEAGQSSPSRMGGVSFVLFQGSCSLRAALTTVRTLSRTINDCNVVQPVSYASLALTLGTGAGILWYFSHERERKLTGKDD